MTSLRGQGTTVEITLPLAAQTESSSRSVI